MSDRPILFSAPMVQALLAGRKTQTRRICSLPEPSDSIIDMVKVATDRATGAPVYEMKDAAGRHVTIRSSKHLVTPQYMPRYAIGDRLWVREAWMPHSFYAFLPPREMPRSEVFYKADNKYAPSNCPWRPGIHMPRWASRLTLIVEDVKVERLQDISEADAIAEGIERSPHGCGTQWIDYPAGKSAAGWLDPRHSFRSLWNSINGPDAWTANPWVCALSFRVIHQNIDGASNE